MVFYLARRLGWALLVMLAVTLVTFVIFYKLPSGDPALRFVGKQPTPESIALVRHNLGLDKPFYVQYAKFLKAIVAGDHYGWPGLGYSYDSKIPIREKIIEKAPRTLSLIAGASLFWLVGGILIGVVSAIKRRTIFDRAAMGFALFGISAPVFWLGLMALFLIWNKIGITAGTGYTPITDNPEQWASHLILPWIVLALLYAAIYARMVRGNLLDAMGEDYIRTARAKGLSEKRVIFKHGLRASLAPIVTMFGLDIALLVGGAVITESVFNLDGLGFMAVDSVFRQDLPATLGVVLVATFAVVIMNLVVDVVYAFLDPPRAVLVSGELLLDVRDLAVQFPTEDGIVNAVSGLSFTLRRGETLGIVGESGSGKSVTNLAILGLLNSKRSRISGEILLQGKDLLKASPEELRDVRGKDVAMIFQDPFACLHPMYRVGTQIAEAVRAHVDVSKDKALERAIEVLDAVGIPNARARARDFPHQFSGGMRQRAMIAMALVHNPAVLIADEPTTALDVTVQAQILELIDKVKRDFDIGVILITHDLGVVAETAQTVMVMYAGRAVEHGPAREVFESPQHPYTWGLLESMPSVEAKVAHLHAIEGSPPSVIHLPPGCPFHPRCPHRFNPCDKVRPPFEIMEGGHGDACHLDAADKRRLWAERRAARVVVSA